MSKHHVMPTLFAVACLAATLSGCVEPDSSRPWSTKSESAESSPAVVGGASVSTAVVMGDEDEVTSPIETGVIEEETSVRERPDSVDAVVVDRSSEAAEIPAASVEPAGGVVGRAEAWLEEAAIHPMPLVRGYAFEAMEHSPALLERSAPAGFIDENRGVRFIATMAVGQTGLVGLVPLIEPGLLDRSDSVRAATIFALRTLGQPTDPTPLARFATSDDPEIRANAIMILGLLGNPSAIPVIESTLGRGMLLANPMRVRITELQAAESLVLLGDQEDVEPIRAALFAPVEQGEVTVLACDILGRLGDEQARSMLMRLVMVDGTQRRPPEIRIAAAQSLLQLSPPHDPQLAGVLLGSVGAADARLRVQVAGALAHLPGPQAIEALTTLLGDEDPLVKTAAAGSLLAQLAGKPAVANTAGD